jgi:vancomycin aglycone glucosyltransferase
MRVLLLSSGTRGDVQPLLALALELRALGHETHLCVAPNFKDWVESFGFPHVPLGRDLRQNSGQFRITPEQEHECAAQIVRAEFLTLTEVARGYALILGGWSFAARSVAEILKIPHIFVTYSPSLLPSPDHPAPRLPGHHYLHTLPAGTNLALWAQYEQLVNDFYCVTLNEERAKLGLAPVESVLRHVITERPWLAADPVLGPAAADMQVVQTGAWLLPDPSPLPEPLECFLADGEPPVFLGFGSMLLVERGGQELVEAARALGLRSILSRGWANLVPIDAGTDCLSIGDVSYERLFARVAAVVHHGGAGTTTAAARAGKPQVIVPHQYDQAYWAHRVQQLGVGISGPTSGSPAVVGMVSALRECLHQDVIARAQQLAPRIQSDGAHVAARRIDREFA